MGLKKLAEEDVSQTMASDTHVIVSQTDEVEGEEIYVIRRIRIDGFARGLPIPVDSTLTVLGKPADAASVGLKIADIEDELSDVVKGQNVSRIVKLTQDEYDAILQKDPMTLYILEG